MDNIKTFQNRAAYNAAGQPTAESRVALISEENMVEMDGVNVETQTPVLGDAVYKDANGVKHALKQNGYNATLVSSGWIYEGVFLYYYKDDRWAVFKGNYASLPSLKFADVVQHAITAISSTSLVIKIRTSADYESDTTVNVTLTSAEINATSAAEISAALNELTDKRWWAYLDGDRIIVQCDEWSNYRMYNVSATGCTISHVTWGDMPASDNYLKVNGRTTNYRGLMNIAGAASFWATFSTRVLSANVAVHSEAGNTDPMKKSDFLTSQYAAEVRAYYKTYENYLRGEFGIPLKQQQGAFNLPDGEALTAKYGPMMAPTKAGSTKAKFPSLNWAYLQGGHLWDVAEGVLMMEDDSLNAINATQRKAGKVTLSNGSNRWFAQRNDVSYAWYFNGYNRNLNNSNVGNTYQVGAVSLL